MERLLPISFSDLLIPAVEQGIKTHTRRIINDPGKKINVQDPPFSTNWEFVRIYNNVIKFWEQHRATNEHYVKIRFAPGDILWVKETYYQFGHWKKAGKTKKGNQKWKFIHDEGTPVLHRNNIGEKISFLKSRCKQLPADQQWYKRNSRFMPLKYARLFLLVKDVAVEQIRDITKQDAKKEGVQSSCCIITGVHYKDYLADASGYGHPDHDFAWAKDAVHSFKSLWIKIHGEPSWNNNDWVLRIEFERTTKPELFYKKLNLV